MTEPSTGVGTATLVLHAVTLPDGRRVDVRLRDGRIAAIDPVAAVGGPAGGTGPHGAVGGDGERLDLTGYLLLPAPAEPHAHLDKAYSADRFPPTGGDLGAAIATWLRYRPTMSEADLLARSGAALRAYLGHGATAVRTHVDVADDIGLRALAAVTAARAAVAGECDVQVVAFVNAPVSGRAGERHRALLREAIAAGADVVGACPAVDPDPAECVETCLAAAADAGVPVDLHVDESLDPEPCTLALLADVVRATGFAHGVVASHCVSLGAMAPERVADLADRVAAAGIAVICLPQTNLYLQGRGHAAAAPRGLTALRALRAAGVTVAAGGDNVQDPFNCLGRADPLETATLLVLAGHDTPEVAYAAVSSAARTALGLSRVDIAVGAPAELLAIRAATVRQALAESDHNRVVIHAGRVVARSRVTREFPTGAGV
jgi:cytosine/creatinine deaminase